VGYLYEKRLNKKFGCGLDIDFGGWAGCLYVQLGADIARGFAVGRATVRPVSVCVLSIRIGN
jgi:hypothetical protein